MTCEKQTASVRNGKYYDFQYFGLRIPSLAMQRLGINFGCNFSQNTAMEALRPKTMVFCFFPKSKGATRISLGVVRHQTVNTL